MSTSWRGLALILAAATLLAVACSDSPQSPALRSSVSGTVVLDQSSSPAAGVTVDFVRHTGMMMSEGWDPMQSVVTDANGRFHFAYMHEAMAHYRVMVHGSSYAQAMCDLDGNDDDIVLRIP